jgi:Xaa-Pro dipeptidase
MKRAGSEGATFRMQVLTRSKQLQAHPYAGNVAIEPDQAIVIHLGASCSGYAAKMCRTVALGQIAPETRRIYEVLGLAQMRAATLLVPGAVASQIYDAVHADIDAAGYGGMILDHLGYGVGIRQSEFFPIVGKGLNHTLATDMVVDLLLPTVFKKNVGGPRITDMFRVTEAGGQFMTTFPRDLVEKA